MPAMTPSARTLSLLARIADAGMRAQVRALLAEEPALCGPPTEEALERTHFAFIKLALEGESSFRVGAELYRIDVRDLLMNAGFALDAKAHEHWYASLPAEQQ